MEEIQSTTPSTTEVSVLDYLQSVPIIKHELRKSKFIDISPYCKFSFDPKYISRTVIQYLKNVDAKLTVVIGTPPANSIPIQKDYPHTREAYEFELEEKQAEIYLLREEKFKLERDMKALKENTVANTAPAGIVPKWTKVVEDTECEKFLLLSKQRMYDYADSSKYIAKLVRDMQRTLREKFPDSQLIQEYDRIISIEGFPKNPTDEEKKKIPYLMQTRFDRLIMLCDSLADYENINAANIHNQQVWFTEITELYTEMMTTGTTKHKFS